MRLFQTCVRPYGEDETERVWSRAPARLGAARICAVRDVLGRRERKVVAMVRNGRARRRTGRFWWMVASSKGRPRARGGYSSYGRSNGPASQPLPISPCTQAWPTNDESGCRSLSLHLRSSLQMPSVNTAPSARGWSKAVLVNFGRLDVLTILHDDRACFQNIFFRGLSGHTYAIPRRDSESSTAQAGSTFSILQFCTHPASSSWCVFVSGQCVDRRHGAPPHDH